MNMLVGETYRLLYQMAKTFGPNSPEDRRLAAFIKKHMKRPYYFARALGISVCELSSIRHSVREPLK